MRSQALRLIIWGQAYFYGGFLIAVVLQPHGLIANSGISYYGIFAKTFIPFEVSLLGAAACTWLSAVHITEADLKPIRSTLFFIAVCTSIVAATPFSNDILSIIHRLAGTLLFTTQLLLSFWLIAKLHHAPWAVLLTIAEFLAGVASAIFLYQVHGYLIQSEVFFQFFFSTLLFYGLRKLPAVYVTKDQLVREERVTR